MVKRISLLAFIAALALVLGACNLPFQKAGPMQQPQEGPFLEEAPPGEPGAAQIVYFLAHRTVLSPGECTGLEWHVEGAPGATLNGEPIEPTGMREVCPADTTRYHLEVDLGGGSLENEVIISVEGAGEPEPVSQPSQPGQAQPTQAGSQTGCGGAPLIVSFGANPGTINAGGSTTLSWGGVTNGAGGTLVKSVVLEPGFGEVGSPGSRTVKPAQTTTYTLKGTGCGGTTSKQVTVVVHSGASGGTGVDLAVTDLYPQNQPKGDVYARITNHGPGSLTNVVVVLKCTSVATDYQTGVKTTEAKSYPSSHTLSLNPGQTKAVDTNVIIDISKHWYLFECNVQAQGTSDPKPGNNSFSETFPPPP